MNPAMNPGAMLSCRQLTLERYYEPIFAPVDLDVSAGEIILVTGPNGSGKTTLIRLLAGALTPSSGTVDISTDSLRYLGHQLGIKDDLSALENVIFYAGLYGSGDTTPALALDRVGLSNARQQAARTLSAGQRKRCALARLLLAPAGLWLLDEPYSNLDRDGAALLETLLSEHLDRGGACVMSTHGDLRPAALNCREVPLKNPVLEP